VIGDLANSTPPGKDPLPGIAPTAIQMGVHAARNIGALVAGEPTTEFVYDDRGQLATIGRNSAVGIAKGVKVKGFIAWLMWLFIHIYFLIGFENRALVMMNWAYSYMSFSRSSRLITGSARKAKTA
ncbi:MAG: NAD(P)/FAD-dependent oxidoreductase, partial [Armatimonadetes bacterium]|nr:NAD(P)/FAD-dependent oxidoreductase [Armatimonadota bacterium]